MQKHAQKNRGSSAVAVVVLTVVSLLVALAIGEVALRAMGYKPFRDVSWVPGKVERDDVPLVTEPHPVRGWANKPGKYVYAGYTPDVESITVTIHEDESRATANTGLKPEPTAPALVFIGGSNTHGWAISDHETMAWKVQSMYPDMRVFNFAVGGYGGFQAFQTLEEKYSLIGGRKIILYGMIGHHINRNVLDSPWVQMFSKPGKGRMPPYLTLNEDGSLRRNPVSQRQPWFFKDRLAMVFMAERAWIDYSTRDRFADRVAVMNGLLTEMQEFADNNGDELVVILLRDLGTPPENEVRAFMETAGITFIDCSPDDYGPEFMVEGEGHPNGKQHTRWANCVSEYLEKTLL